MKTEKSGKGLLKKFSEPASVIFMLAIAFYLVQAIFAVFSKTSPPILDFVTVTSLLILAFVLHLYFKFDRIVPIFLCIGFFLHIIGLYKIIPYNPYYVGELYGAPQLNYHYDWIVHIFGFGFLAAAFSSMVYPYLSRAFKSRFAIFLIILLATLGMGSLNEVVEFLGYGVYGYGEGFLEFGSGDTSPNGSPWQNSSMDMVNNLIGGIVFIGIFVLSKHGSLSGKKGREGRRGKEKMERKPKQASQ